MSCAVRSGRLICRELRRQLRHRLLVVGVGLEFRLKRGIATLGGSGLAVGSAEGEGEGDGVEDLPPNNPACAEGRGRGKGGERASERDDGCKNESFHGSFWCAHALAASIN